MRIKSEGSWGMMTLGGSDQLIQELSEVRQRTSPQLTPSARVCTEEGFPARLMDAPNSFV